ncbi:uncharacterized protein PITG_02219 [Phytophthora infestans T30-4]|uniref:TRAF-type domain-containing protein n=1 Tax=Phytophthora infestans (strain T30-4) TaxID=403677 RepID=D0MVS3_PHYIT|nr:uncharacterized protein PITG_02219 [Phytophthora infestans T30-4]EEY63736.1 conserved hypothetical protein [Phytophthora infestans T30-4]|eukprot:XP_002907172.1 conserved hypothetical protein [Phytophthora infestans T30-4]
MITNDEIPANYETRTGETALLAAVSAKNLDALAMLMTSGVSIDTPNRQGYTPLMKAIAVAVPQHRCASKQLILTDQSGRTAFDWAKLTGNTQALEWLENRQREKSLKHQSLANRQDRVAQCQALLSYHEECIQRIESLIALQFFDENGLVEFLKATTISVSEFTRAFNDLKAMDNTPRALPFRSQFFVNIETREGWTPLTKCAAFGYAFGVQELVSMGADYRYETRLRHTAMTWASYCGHEAVVLHLLRVGVDVNQKTRDGKTALMHAISNSQAKIVHHLLIATRDECFPIEWHKTFLKTMKWQDRTGKDALKLAQDAVEQTEAMYTELPDVYSSDQEEELPPAVHVLWQVQIALKDAEDHRKYVELHAERTKLTTCHNDNCSFVAPKDMLPTHEQHHCMKRTIKCENCDSILIFEDRGRHDTQTCPMRRVQCSNFQFGCHEQILFQDREFHLNYHCRKRAIKCRLLCGTTVHHDELDEHESARCSLRIITCDQGCQAKFTANFAKKHRLHECPKRMVPCKGKHGGCSALVKYDEMDFHLSTLCELRELSCKWASYGCEEKIAGVAAGRYIHETQECPFRFVACQNGCELSGQFLACFAEEHYRWQCMLERIPCPNKCQDKQTGEVLQLSRELMMAHVLQDSGDCPLRETHCPLDLCGKHVRLVDKCRILTYDPTKSQHLLEFSNGHSEWTSLELHCCHRLVPCPLDCGQRLPAHTAEFHLAKRCNMRNTVCRLGCGEIMAFGLVSEHESGYCEFRSEFCEYCHFSISIENLETHLDKECQQRPRGCRLGCSRKVAWSDVKEHEANQCPKRRIKCRICQGDIWFCELENHEKDECPLRIYGQCDDSCGQNLRYNEIAHHLLFNCTKRVVKCKYCKQRLKFDTLQEHHELLCPQRVVNCRRGCGTHIKELDSDLHESEECSKRLLFCENQCGLHVPYCEMEEHLEAKCTLRVMMCPTGCREMVFAYLYEDHWKRCRQRVVPCGVGGKLCARPIRVWHMDSKLVRCVVHNENALLWALKSQDLDLATYFLQNVDAFNVVNEEFANGFSPLVLAASLGNIDLIQLLFRFGADVNLETSRGRTPLSEACMAQDVDIVKLLIENRACVSHTNKQGRNLLEMIIHLLEDQVELERAQRDLFIAISCSNYDHLIEHFKYSAKTRSHTHFVNPLETLQELVTAKEKQANTVRAELDEAIQVFNESIAETEAKRVQAIQLSSQVDDSCRRLQNVEKDEEASDIDSSALEADMLAMIRQITAQDIAQLLNSHVPSDTSLVVVKALSLLCGVVPRGRRNATEYTDVEWWKTAQALLMDRSLLRQLRGYRQQTISPEVMAKVRRECLKTPAFAACSAEFKANRASFKTESGERSLNSRIPPIETLRGNIIGMLATWVQGVELEYKTRAERQALVERKRQLEVALTMARERQQHSRFEAQVGVRSLPARQEEVEAVRTQHDVARKEVEAAKKRLDTYKLLNYAALSGHTPLTFACAVGNEAIIHMLLSHGACSGHQFEEQNLCASFIQALVRDFQYRKKFERQRRLQELSRGGTNSRSDAATEALVRNVAHSFIVGHYQRKLVHFRQTHRVAIHEAIINGNPEIAAILLSKGAKLWQKTYVLPERVYPGSLLESVAPISKASLEMAKRQGKWKLQPLAMDKKNSQKAQEDDDFGKPMTVADTLSCAVKYYDSRLFDASRGWEPDVTAYSTTAEFQLMSRRNVIRKTTELKEKHAALETAIISRDFVAISRLLDDGAFADYETSGGAMSALMAACVEEVYVENEDGKDVLAAEYLLDRTMNRPLVDLESSRGLTALGTAAFFGTLKCAQALIERGARVNFAARLNGHTALMIAATNGKVEFVRYLLASKGVDVFLRDSSGKTASDYARTSGFTAIAGLLEAAMGGKHDRVVNTISGLYGVCKWGCGFMTLFEDHLVQKARIVKNINPLQEHELHRCLKRLVTCPNGCDITELWAEDVKDHSQHTCELRLVNCSNQKCTVRFLFKDRGKHLQDECEYRVIVCECGEAMSYQRHVLHAKTQCPMRLVPCPLQCLKPNDAQSQEFQLRWQDVRIHVNGNCSHRQVRCRNGCAINDLLLKDRVRHETEVCLLRRVECAWGCNETVLANAQALHEREECELRQQSCPNRCGYNNVPVRELDEHISVKCSRRLVQCSLGCGRRTPLHTIDTHISQDCRKRTITCGHCHQSLKEEDRMTHQKQCPHRLAVCGLCGQTNLSHLQMAHHRKEECKMRQVTCKYQCSVKTLVAHEKERHEMWECAYRPIWCSLGCGEVFICNTVKEHQRSCTMRFVDCGYGCGEELREKDRADHEQYHCSLNKVQQKT